MPCIFAKLKTCLVVLGNVVLEIFLPFLQDYCDVLLNLFQVQLIHSIYLQKKLYAIKTIIC